VPPWSVTYSHVTFTVLWSGPFYALAVDYSRYCIAIYRPFNANELKYVIYECFKYVAKWSIIGDFAKLKKKLTARFVIVVRWLLLMYFNKIWLLINFPRTVMKFMLDEIMTSITGILHKKKCTFSTIARWILLRIRNVTEQICRPNQRTILCSISLLWNHVVCEIMWENALEPDTAQMMMLYGSCLLHVA